MRKSFLFCAVLFLCGALVGCGAGPDSQDQNRSGSPSGAEPSSEEASAEPPGSASAVPDPGSEDGQAGSACIYTTEDNIIPMSESATIDGIACQILGCEVTSEFGNRNLENLNYFYEEEGIDDKGNLQNDRTYIFLTFQYTNTTDAEVEIVRGTVGVYRLDERLIVRDYSVDAAYIDECWLEGTASEVNHYRLKPGETITSEVGYIVGRDFVEGSGQLYFALRQSDCQGDFGASTDPEAVFVELEYGR